MLLIPCPRCGEAVRFSAGNVPPDAQGRCPWCRERFPLTEAMDQLPPALEIFTADGHPWPEDVPVASSAEAGGSGGVDGLELLDPEQLDSAASAADREQSPAEGQGWGQEIHHLALGEQHTSGGGWSDRAEEEGAARRSESGWAEGGQGTVAPMRVQPATEISLRHKARRPSTWRTMIQIALGPVIALPLAGAILIAFNRAPDLGFYPFDGTYSQGASPRAAPPRRQSEGRRQRIDPPAVLGSDRSGTGRTGAGPQSAGPQSVEPQSAGAEPTTSPRPWNQPLDDGQSAGGQNAESSSMESPTAAITQQDGESGQRSTSPSATSETNPDGLNDRPNELNDRVAQLSPLAPATPSDAATSGRADDGEAANDDVMEIVEIEFVGDAGQEDRWTPPSLSDSRTAVTPEPTSPDDPTSPDGPASRDDPASPGDPTSQNETPAPGDPPSADELSLPNEPGMQDAPAPQDDAPVPQDDAPAPQDDASAPQDDAPAQDEPASQSGSASEEMPNSDVVTEPVAEPAGASDATTSGESGESLAAARGADLSAARERALNRLDELNQIGSSDGQTRNRAMALAYQAVAQVAALAADGDRREVEPVLAQLRKAGLLEAFGAVAPDWFRVPREKRGSDGILLVGEVRRGDGKTRLWVNDEQSVVLESATVGTDGRELPTDGTRQVIMGRILRSGTEAAVEPLVAEPL